MAHKRLHDCYELKGASLSAARALEAEVLKALKDEKPLNSGNLADIQASWQQFYQRLRARLQNANPQLLDAVGLAQPSTVVKSAKGEFSRAYLEYPQIFISPERTPRYFMYVPRDHANAAFVPQDAQRLPVSKEQVVSNMLFAGGWGGSAPLLSLPRMGVALPADLAAKHITLSFIKAAEKFSAAEVSFIATGRALAQVREYEDALTHYNAAVTTAFDALKAAAEKLYPQMLQSLPQGEGLYTNLSGSSQLIAGADTCLTLSICRDGKGKGSDIFAGGKSIPIPDNPYFKTLPHQSGSAVVTRDDTAEGRALALILRAVPAKRPTLADYPQLCAGGKVPVLATHGQYKILRYFIDDPRKAIVAPVDAVPFPPAALAWLRADEQDRRMGDVPPPMPQQLMHYLVHAQGARDSKVLPAKPPKNSGK